MAIKPCKVVAVTFRDAVDVSKLGVSALSQTQRYLTTAMSDQLTITLADNGWVVLAGTTNVRMMVPPSNVQSVAVS